MCYLKRTAFVSNRRRRWQFDKCDGALGDKDESFTWLEKAYEDNSSFLTTLKYWVTFDSLRQDPRFVDLERRVKLRP